MPQGSFWSQLWDNVSKFFSGRQTPPVPPAPPPPVRPNPAPPEPTGDTATALLLAHNRLRAQYGVAAVTGQGQLWSSAQKHATWMADNRNMVHEENVDSIDYDAREFYDRIKLEGYSMRTGGENIAAGQATPGEVMNTWMKSPDHRANILNPDFWNAGFGVARDNFGHLYWCAVFATPLGRATLARHQVKVHLPPALVKRL
jgi:uncharacterized protein YkwD